MHWICLESATIPQVEMKELLGKVELLGKTELLEKMELLKQRDLFVTRREHLAFLL